MFCPVQVLRETFLFEYFSRYVWYVLTNFLLCIICSWLLTLSLFLFFSSQTGGKAVVATVAATQPYFRRLTLLMSNVVPNHFQLSQCTWAYITMNIGLPFVRLLIYLFEVIPNLLAISSTIAMFVWSLLLYLYISFYFLFSFGTCTGVLVSSSTACSIRSRVVPLEYFILWCGNGGNVDFDQSNSADNLNDHLNEVFTAVWSILTETPKCFITIG